MIFIHFQFVLNPITYQTSSSHRIDTVKLQLRNSPTEDESEHLLHVYNTDPNTQWHRHLCLQTLLTFIYLRPCAFYQKALTGNFHDTSML